jgi:hypothetical protein
MIPKFSPQSFKFFPHRLHSRYSSSLRHKKTAEPKRTRALRFSRCYAKSLEIRGFGGAVADFQLKPSKISSTRQQDFSRETSNAQNPRFRQDKRMSRKAGDGNSSGVRFNPDAPLESLVLEVIMEWMQGRGMKQDRLGKDWLPQYKDGGSSFRQMCLASRRLKLQDAYQLSQGLGVKFEAVIQEARQRLEAREKPQSETRGAGGQSLKGKILNFPTK